jgi:hypothetical protein
MLTDLHEKPGRLREILGPGDAQPQEQAPGSNPIADMLASPAAKAVLAGIAAKVVKRVMQGRQRGGFDPTPASRRLLAADARTRSADITDYYAGKTSRVELRGDQVGLKSCVRWNPVGTNGLPEGISLHRVSRQSDVTPPTCAL